MLPGFLLQPSCKMWSLAWMQKSSRWLDLDISPMSILGHAYRLSTLSGPASRRPSPNSVSIAANSASCAGPCRLTGNFSPTIYTSLMISSGRFTRQLGRLENIRLIAREKSAETDVAFSSSSHRRDRSDPRRHSVPIWRANCSFSNYFTRKEGSACTDAARASYPRRRKDHAIPFRGDRSIGASTTGPRFLGHNERPRMACAGFRSRGRLSDQPFSLALQRL